MNFAVIKLQGHQEIASLGTQLSVDKMEAKVGDKVSPVVLLTSIGDKVEIGTPVLDFPIELEVVEHKRGEKIYVSKFHAKARFRKRIGFRRDLTVLKVVKLGDETQAEPAKKAIKKETTVAKKAPTKTAVKKTAKTVKAVKKTV
jgi:large subunit ribosomal protein L21